MSLYACFETLWVTNFSATGACRYFKIIGVCSQPQSHCWVRRTHVERDLRHSHSNTTNFNSFPLISTNLVLCSSYENMDRWNLPLGSAHASTQFRARSNAHSITSIFARHLCNISCYGGGVSTSACVICVIACLVIYLGVHLCYFTSIHAYTSLWIGRCRREWGQYLPLPNQYIYDSQQLHCVRFLRLIIPNHYKLRGKGCEVKWYYWPWGLQILPSYCLSSIFSWDGCPRSW